MHVDDGNTGGEVYPQIAVPGVAFFLAPILLRLTFLDLVTHAGIEQRAEFSEWSHIRQRTSCDGPRSVADELRATLVDEGRDRLVMVGAGEEFGLSRALEGQGRS